MNEPDPGRWHRSPGRSHKNPGRCPRLNAVSLSGWGVDCFVFTLKGWERSDQGIALVFWGIALVSVGIALVFRQGVALVFWRGIALVSLTPHPSLE